MTLTYVVNDVQYSRKNVINIILMSVSGSLVDLAVSYGDHTEFINDISFFMTHEEK